MTYNPLSTISTAHTFEDVQSFTARFVASTAATIALPAEWYNTAAILEVDILYGTGCGTYRVSVPAAKADSPSLAYQTQAPTGATTPQLGANHPGLAISASATPSANTTAHNFTVLKDTDDGVLSVGVHSNSNAGTIMIRRIVPSVTA